MNTSITELMDMGHSEKWAKKKIQLLEIDEQIDTNEVASDKLMNSGKPFSLISAELDRLQDEHDKLQDEREEVYSELCNIED